MAKASKETLESIHGMLAKAILEDLEWLTTETLDEDGKPIPKPRLDPATINAVSKFLKDNEITADPKDIGELHALRDKLSGLVSGGAVARAKRLELND